MKLTLRAMLLPLLAAAVVAGETGAAAATRRPNIIFLLADDLGYGDIGAFGQRKIRTPNLDRLAAEGMRLTQHYAGNAVCAPSRCVLLTGLHPGHAFIRDNQQAKAAGYDFPEGQHPVPPDTLQLPLLLSRLGYATGAFGKWGLGPVGSTGDPARQGIAQFFGFNCQSVAHNYFPTSLWDNARQLPLDNPPFAAHQKLPADADPNDPASYERYRGREYAPDRIAERARQFIRDHQREPFFLYFPTTVPHLALQVPEDSLAEYAGAFPETPFPGRPYLPHRTPRAAYAAMVTRLDREIGRLMQLVAELGLDEHTIFIFTSDNGPLYDRFGGTDTDFFGSAGPFRGRKGSLYEGGVRVPCLVRWKGRIAAGTSSDRVTGFEDWLPTLLELIGEKKATPAKLDGISFAPTLLGKRQRERPFLYREFPGYGGQQSVRVGNWKAIRKDLAQRKGRTDEIRTELYDLASDPGETTDVATKHPEVRSKLERLLAEQHVASAEFPLPAIDPARKPQRP
jgi:arylsulfatase A-like enzyme